MDSTIGVKRSSGLYYEKKKKKQRGERNKLTAKGRNTQKKAEKVEEVCFEKVHIKSKRVARGLEDYLQERNSARRADAARQPSEGNKKETDRKKKMKKINKEKAGEKRRRGRSSAIEGSRGFSVFTECMLVCRSGLRKHHVWVSVMAQPHNSCAFLVLRSCRCRSGERNATRNDGNRRLKER